MTDLQNIKGVANPGEQNIGCMGLPGTYAAAAAARLYPDDPVVFFKKFEAVTQAVKAGLCTIGVLPIDNTTTGSVDAVYDLLSQNDLKIVKSITLPVEHSFLAPELVDFRAIKEVYSHEQALRQCAKFLRQYVPEAKLTAVPSTATAARLAAQSGRGDLAAIAAPECGQLYGLRTLKTNIADMPLNRTRFVAIGRTEATGQNRNKGSLIARLPHEPGALYKLIGGFAKHNLNLTKLESRPIPEQPFEYRFYFDFDYVGSDADWTKILNELTQKAVNIQFLGRYADLGLAQSAPELKKSHRLRVEEL